MGGDVSDSKNKTFLFQVNVIVSEKEITTLYLIRARKTELNSRINEYVKSMYSDYTGFDALLGYYSFYSGLVRCRIGRVTLITETIANSLSEDGVITDITMGTMPTTYDEIIQKCSHVLSNSPKRGLKMSGRLYTKNFLTCIRCSSSIITGKPSNIDPAWNSAHLYNSMKAEEQSFRNLNGIASANPLNISWAVPVKDEIVRGEGRCEFCHSYCDVSRTIVSMIVVL